MRHLTIFSIILFVVYLPLLPAWPGPDDGGELAVTVRNISVAHPAGFPGYILLGRVISSLNPGSARFLTLLSAIAASLSGGLLFLTSLKSGVKPLVAAFALMPLFFSKIWIVQATRVEVYSSFLLILLWSAYLLSGHNENSSFNQENDDVSDNKFENNSLKKSQLGFFLLFIATGFHITGFIYAGSFIILALISFAWSKKRGNHTSINLRKLISGICISSILGASIYLYIPVASSGDRFPDWGNPETVSNFVGHISGTEKNVQARLFGMDLKMLQYQIIDLIKALSEHYGIPFLVTAIVGISSALFHKKQSLLYFSLIGAVCLIFNLNIARAPSTRMHFYIPLTAVMALFSAHGYSFMQKLVLRIYMKSSKKPDSGKVLNSDIKLIIALSLILLIPMIYGVEGVVSAYKDFDAKTESKAALQWTVDVNNLLPEGAVLFVEGDEALFPLWYSQQVEGKRTDVHVVARSMLRADWYFRRVMNNWPFKSEELKKLSAEENDVTPVDKELRLTALKNSVPKSLIYSDSPEFLMFTDVETISIVADVPLYNLEIQSENSKHTSLFRIKDYVKRLEKSPEILGTDLYRKRYGQAIIFHAIRSALINHKEEAEISWKVAESLIEDEVIILSNLMSFQKAIQHGKEISDLLNEEILFNNISKVHRLWKLLMDAGREKQALRIAEQFYEYSSTRNYESTLMLVLSRKKLGLYREALKSISDYNLTLHEIIYPEHADDNSMQRYNTTNINQENSEYELALALEAGRIMIAENNTGGAGRIVDFLESKGLKSISVEISLFIAEYHLKWGNIQKAENTLLVSRKIRPDTPDVLTLLGKIMWSQGKETEAVSLWEKAISLPGSSREAEEALITLRGYTVKPGS